LGSLWYCCAEFLLSLGTSCASRPPRRRRTDVVVKTRRGAGGGRGGSCARTQSRLLRFRLGSRVQVAGRWYTGRGETLNRLLQSRTRGVVAGRAGGGQCMLSESNKSHLASCHAVYYLASCHEERTPRDCRGGWGVAPAHA
jgi:hypothetical protein